MLSSALSVTFPVVCEVMTWPIVIEPDWSSMLMLPFAEVAFNVPGLGLAESPLFVRSISKGAVPPMPLAAVRVMFWPPTDPPEFSCWMLPSGALRVVEPAAFWIGPAINRSPSVLTDTTCPAITLRRSR